MLTLWRAQIARKASGAVKLRALASLVIALSFTSDQVRDMHTFSWVCEESHLSFCAQEGASRWEASLPPLDEVRSARALSSEQLHVHTHGFLYMQMLRFLFCSAQIETEVQELEQTAPLRALSRRMIPVSKVQKKEE